MKGNVFFNDELIILFTFIWRRTNGKESLGERRIDPSRHRTMSGPSTTELDHALKERERERERERESLEYNRIHPMLRFNDYQTNTNVTNSSAET